MKKEKIYNENLGEAQEEEKRGSRRNKKRKDWNADFGKDNNWKKEKIQGGIQKEISGIRIQEKKVFL